MKLIHKVLCSLAGLGALSALSLHAGSTTVLEGYENGFTTNSGGVTNIQQFTLYGNGHGAPVAISLYTSAGPGDPRVTEGTHSAKIVFPSDGFGNDIGIGLSDAACSMIENAASSNQLARYILRYDVIFENINLVSYFNQTFFIADEWDYVRSGGAMLTNYGGESFGISSYSVPLELPGIAIPTNAPSGQNSLDFAAAGVPGLTAFIADQFGAVTEPLTNFTIYLDNFRLIDTYATPFTTPVVYELQSFESPTNRLGGASDLATGTTTLTPYNTNGLYNSATDGGVPNVFTAGYPSPLANESDFSVTDGTNSLEIDCTGGYYNYDIFSLPLAGTKLGEILSQGLSPAQLAHYQVRWDVTTPMVPIANGGADGDYLQIDYNAPQGSIFPMSTGRRQYDNQTGLQRETYSATLDQIAYWGASPALALSYSQEGYPSATWGQSPFFIDNIRLIDTAPVGPSSLVLEGYENGFTTNSGGVTNIQQFTLYGNGHGAPVAISLYTAAGPGDPRVTQGTHSAKIVFPGDGFGNDIGIGLSDAACSMIENAASSNQLARYILRYDVIFENINLISYFNQTFFIANEWDYVRSGGAMLTNYNGEQFGISSYSVPLELPGIGIPHNPPSGDNALDFAAAGVPGLTAFIADQFAAVTEPLTNFTIYLDNFRLIDTYATPTTTPAVYELQSFESGSNPLGGATNLAPGTTTLTQYADNGLYNSATDSGVSNVYTAGYPSPLANESDFSVTDGSHSLEIDCAGGYYNYDIFSLPLAGTKLGDVLSQGLTPAQLAHYQVRWDVTTPMVPIPNGGADGDYLQIDYNAPSGSIFPMSTGRRQYQNQTGLQRETYSATLDQIAYWGPTPALALSYSQEGYPSATWGQSPFFIDNVRLIDTTPSAVAPSINITSGSYNAATKAFTLTWSSAASQTYTLQYTPSLNSAFTSLATGIASGGSSTTYTATVPAGASGFLRVVAP